MKKLEIVLSQAVEDDFLLKCKQKNVGKAYTKINNVCGEGCQVPKLGDPIWPQLNSFLMIVCDEHEAQIISDIVLDLRVEYPQDGIFCCVSDVKVV